ncbi:MAG: hypothetical protein LIP02_08790 [Bacteroidales bacterium]|nr:hypothetical protein [Bacteroidales bacterium]
MLTAMIVVSAMAVAFLALAVWGMILNDRLEHRVATLEGENDYFEGLNGQRESQLVKQSERFDDLVARNSKEMKEPLTHSFIRLPPWNKAVEVYGRTVNNRDILIARFDTPDPEYNRNLAQDLCEKLNEKPV